MSISMWSVQVFCERIERCGNYINMDFNGALEPPDNAAISRALINGEWSAPGGNKHFCPDHKKEATQ